MSVRGYPIRVIERRLWVVKRPSTCRSTADTRAARWPLHTSVDKYRTERRTTLARTTRARPRHRAPTLAGLRASVPDASFDRLKVGRGAPAVDAGLPFWRIQVGQKRTEQCQQQAAGTKGIF